MPYGGWERALAGMDRLSFDDPNSGCRLFAGSQFLNGHGKINVYVDREHKTVGAHRLAYWREHGQWPPLIRHKCHTPVCVNPLHLIAGTHGDNARDKVKAGRWKGGRPPEWKLVAAEKAIAAGLTTREIMAVSGLTQRAVRDRMRGLVKRSARDRANG